MNRARTRWLLWTALVGAVLLGGAYSVRVATEPEVAFSDFLAQVEVGQIEAVSIRGDEVAAIHRTAGRFQTYVPHQYEGLVNRLVEHRVKVRAQPQLVLGGGSVELTLVMLQIGLAWLGWTILSTRSNTAPV